MERVVISWEMGCHYWSLLWLVVLLNLRILGPKTKRTELNKIRFISMFSRCNSQMQLTWWWRAVEWVFLHLCLRHITWYNMASGTSSEKGGKQNQIVHDMDTHNIHPQASNALITLPLGSICIWSKVVQQSALFQSNQDPPNFSQLCRAFTESVLYCNAACGPRCEQENL